MKSKYFLAAISAFTIWGFFSLVLKPMHVYKSVDILFYRLFMCGFLMLLFNILFRKKILLENLTTFREIPRRRKFIILGLTLGGGLLLVANWFFFIYVMNHISIKAASFAYLVCPILTTLMAWFILKEKLSNWQWTAVALSLISCVLLSFNNIADILYSLIVAVTYAFYLISQRKNTGFDKFLVLSIQLIFGALFLLPFFPHYGTNMGSDISFYIQILVVAVVFTIIPLYLNLYSLQGLKSSTMGILLYLNPLINFGIAIFYYNEPMNSLQVFSYLLIGASIIIFNEKIIFRRSHKLHHEQN